MRIPRRADLEDLEHSELVTLAQEALAELARRALRQEDADISRKRESDRATPSVMDDPFHPNNRYRSW